MFVTPTILEFRELLLCERLEEQPASDRAGISSDIVGHLFGTTLLDSLEGKNMHRLPYLLQSSSDLSIALSRVVLDYYSDESFSRRLKILRQNIKTVIFKLFGGLSADSSCNIIRLLYNTTAVVSGDISRRNLDDDTRKRCISALCRFAYHLLPFMMTGETIINSRDALAFCLDTQANSELHRKSISEPLRLVCRELHLHVDQKRFHRIVSVGRDAAGELRTPSPSTYPKTFVCTPPQSARHVVAMAGRVTGKRRLLDI